MTFLKTSAVELGFNKNYLEPALTKAGFGKDKLNLMPFDEGHPKVDIISYVDTMFNDKESAKYLSGLFL